LLSIRKFADKVLKYLIINGISINNIYQKKSFHTNESGLKMLTQHMWRLLNRYLELCKVDEVQNTKPTTVMKTSERSKRWENQDKNLRNQTMNIKVWQTNSHISG